VEIDYSKLMDKVRFWKHAIESSKDFSGTSPPSVFVGRFNYPKVYVGVLAPPMHQEDSEAMRMDSPEEWYKSKATIDQILNFRGQMIYSRFSSPVKAAAGKLIDATQEVAMAKRPAEIEVGLRKEPKFNLKFDSYASPVGNPAPLESLRLTANPVVEHKVDYLISDTDLKASDAVKRLYSYGLPVSRIQKIMSSGLLGVRFQRKLVPTRWGVTAVDDIIGKGIIDRVKQHQELGEIRLFSNQYLGNHYEILLIPGPYEYELVEAWDVDKPSPVFGADYERNWLRDKYADSTHGAFYSGRLAVGEYLDSIKRQSMVLIVREVTPDYFAPVGIWQLRETVRGAFQKPYETFPTLTQAFARISERLYVKNRWMNRSTMIRNMKEQRKLGDFIGKLTGQYGTPSDPVLKI
jgi:DNA repair protein NreA